MIDRLALCYHGVSDSWPSTMAVRREALRSQVASLLARGYRGATFTETVTGAARGRVLAVTFDDGYRSVLAGGLPVLQELGVPATLYVPTAWVGAEGPMMWPGIAPWATGPHAAELEPLGWDDLAELAAAGWEIGSHTVSHPRLPELADAELDRELRDSRAEIEDRLGRPCTSIAYPYGAMDERVVAAAGRAGYTAAGALPVRYPLRARPLAWPRVGVWRDDDDARFGREVSRSVRLLRTTPVYDALSRVRRHFWHSDPGRPSRRPA